MTTEQPKLEIDFNSSKRWYLNDKLHREDGPAVERVNGDKCWYLNGKLHREDGPACEFANGTKYWFLHDKDVTKNVEKLMKSGLSEIEVLSFLVL